MARTRLRLWECPNGEHPAVRGPSRPRRDDVRRYCLRCSEASGRLVERVCPALEREREATATKARERREAQQRRAREAERAQHVLGVRERDGSIGECDIPRVLSKMMRLPAMRDLVERRSPYLSAFRNPPKVNLRRSSFKSYTSGHAPVGTWEFTVTAAHNPTREEFEEVLLHELVHLCLPSHEWHGARFRRTLVRAAREWWPGRVTARPDEDAEMYGLDNRIVQQASEGTASRSRFTVAA